MIFLIVNVILYGCISYVLSVGGIGIDDWEFYAILLFLIIIQTMTYREGWKNNA